MPNGYWQKLLRVDLSTGTHTVEPLAEADLKRFIGGAGLGAEILRRELPPKVGAFEPRNRLIFATGPFQCPAAPNSASWASRPCPVHLPTRPRAQAGALR